MGKPITSCRVGGLSMVLLALLGTGAGCTRQFFRTRVDDEVSSLLCEKDRIPLWKVQNMYVYPDSRARFADPNRPDRPPMPPDDPGADLLAPRPQRPPHAGIKWQEGTAYLDLLARFDAENRALREAEKQQQADKGEKAALSTEETLQAAFRQLRSDTAEVRALRTALIPDHATTPTAVGSVRQVAFLQPQPTPPREELPTPRLQSAPDVEPTEGAGATSLTTSIDINSYILKGQLGVKPFLFTWEQGLQLALFNSREYQTRREDLYLAALPVTLQRFTFAGQGVMAGTLIREHAGKHQTNPGNNYVGTSSASYSKLFSTGALLLFQFANQTVINLGTAMHPQTTSVSTINFDFIQPLLRGGGKAVTLEPLTTAERNLLYNVRTFARFRKQYFQFFTGGTNLPGVGGGTGLSTVSAATGATSAFGTIGVNTGGNVGPNGLSTAGLGPVVIPGVIAGSGLPANPVTPGPSGSLLVSFTPSAPSEGLYSTILKAGVLDIDLLNIRRLREGLKLFEGFEEGGEVSKLQVDQVRLQLLSGLSTVLNDAKNLRDSFDNIKLQMGLPVTTQLEIDQGLIRPVMKHMSRFEDVINAYESTAKQLDELDTRDQPAQLRAGLLRLWSESPLTRETTQLKKRTPVLWQQMERLSAKELQERLGKLREERRILLETKEKLLDQDKKLNKADQVRLTTLERELNVAELEFAVRRYEVAPWNKAPNPLLAQEVRAARWRDVRNAVALILSEASNERLDLLRPNWPKLPQVLIDGVDIGNDDIEKAYAVTIKAALDNRLDLMNARAQVHDAWRQIAVLANGLLGVLNAGYQMNASTPPGMGTPLAFRPDRTTHQLVFNFQLPLVRIQERNTYRASLIAYQRARRALMEAEDTIVNSIRQEVRNLQVLAKNFIIQQQNVELAFLQVESSLETFRAPPAPGTQVGNAANAAALTNQVLQSYSRVPTVQGQLLNNWVTFITARQQIFLDTELMQVDTQGVWIDEFTQSNQPSVTLRPCFGQPIAGPVGSPAALEQTVSHPGGLAE
jgi:outer membrane protein TolC